MNGVDISEHQSHRGPDWFRQFDFAIIRVHSGYRDDFMWEYHLADCKEAGVPFGFYGYLQGNVNPAWQAQRMVDLTSGQNPPLGWWSDVEDPTVDWNAAGAHIGTLRGLVPGRFGVYSNIGDYEAFLRGQADDLPWWMADYGSNEGTRHDPYEQPPVPHRGWSIHQYTSYPGLDQNYAEKLPFSSAPTPAGRKFDMYAVQDERGFLFLHTGGRLTQISPDFLNATVLAQNIPLYLGFDSAWVEAEQASLKQPKLRLRLPKLLPPTGAPAASTRRAIRAELDDAEISEDSE